MEIKTKFNPGQEVFFMYENKVASGIINMTVVRSVFEKAHHYDQGNKTGDIKTSFTYQVIYKWVKKSESEGFIKGDESKEKYLDFKEEQLFSSKEELLKTL